ncbi:MAG: glycosyltransferase [Henriciella sp.]|nr:glycosyltransferase [Henriciella sp.]
MRASFLDDQNPSAVTETASPRIAVTIPCYNEAVTIAKVVQDFKTALPEAVIYVFDNNSSDNTAQIAADAGAIVRV